MMQLVCVWDMVKGREKRPQIILHEVSQMLFTPRARGAGKSFPREKHFVSISVESWSISDFNLSRIGVRVISIRGFPLATLLLSLPMCGFHCLSQDVTLVARVLKD